MIRCWKRPCRNDRAQAYWSDGDTSLVVTGDTDLVDQIVGDAAEACGHDRPELLEKAPPVIPGQTAMEVPGA